jgi:hypothetical protein
MPPFQNLGVGTRLMETAETFLVSKGFVTCEIGVEKDKSGSKAKRLYEKLGYEVDCENIEEFDYTTPEGETVHSVIDEWIMLKSLVLPASSGHSQ